MDEVNQQLFRDFLTRIVQALFHELGHVLITYLSKGRELTPSHIHALNEDAPGSEGEAGRALEYLVFGGTINYFKDPITGTQRGQACSTSTALVHMPAFSVLMLMLYSSVVQLF